MIGINIFLFRNNSLYYVMKFSNDTEAVLHFLDEITENELNQRDDLGMILEIGAANGKDVLVNKIIFTGKTIHKLKSKKDNLSPGAEGFDLLEKELVKNIGEMAALMEGLIANAAEDMSEHFKNKYLSDAYEAYENFIELSEDLSTLKDLQNKKKNR